MDEARLEERIRSLRRRTGRRYAEMAYYFVLEAIDYTLYLLARDQLRGEARHLDGQELLEGIRALAREEFGPLAPFVFEAWGIRRTEDFGELVFQMCDAGLLKKRDSDRIEDFRDGFDIETAFRGLDPIPARSLQD